MKKIKYTALATIFLHMLTTTNQSDLTNIFNTLLSKNNHYDFRNNSSINLMPAAIRITRREKGAKTIYTTWIKNNTKIKRNHNTQNLISLIQQLESNESVATEFHTTQNLVKYTFICEKINNTSQNNPNTTITTVKKKLLADKTVTKKIEPAKKRAGDFRRKK